MKMKIFQFRTMTILYTILYYIYIYIYYIILYYIIYYTHILLSQNVKKSFFYKNNIGIQNKVKQGKMLILVFIKNISKTKINMLYIFTVPKQKVPNEISNINHRFGSSFQYLVKILVHKFW